MELKQLDSFVKDADKTASTVTYKEFADYLTDTAAFLNVQYPKEECLSQEDTAIYNTIKSWREKLGQVTMVQQSLVAPVKLLIKAGGNKLIVDVTKYSNLKEAKESIKSEINNSLGNDILNNTMFYMDFKGSTYTANYNPKDISFIAFKIEDGLHKLLSKYF